MKYYNYFVEFVDFKTKQVDYKDIENCLYQCADFLFRKLFNIVSFSSFFSQNST